MSERDIRLILKKICEDLELKRHANRVYSSGKKAVLPAILGASLTLGGTACLQEAGDPVLLYGVPDHLDASYEDEEDAASSDETDAGQGELDTGALPPYMAPPEDAGPAELYGVLVDAGPQEETDASQPDPRDVGQEEEIDAGAVPPYMAPPEDS